MQLLVNQMYVVLMIFSAHLLLLQSVQCSPHESQTNKPGDFQSIRSHAHKYKPDVTDIRLHGLLLWSSMGVLMPVGILLIRMCSKQESQGKARVLYYLHGIFQVVSVLLVTAAAVLSIQKFENSFKNNHQRVGLALYAGVWFQALLGFCRPHRGRKGRSKWYFAHWLSGTAITLTGITNIYTGLGSYHRRTEKGTGLWVALFTAEICDKSKKAKHDTSFYRITTVGS
uniref:Cytochrome b561 domain-containing protein n=1 Tax=Kalanchoe fedtschenkoi TaxID=63787 RepID=A0A7N0T455_KALFE